MPNSAERALPQKNRALVQAMAEVVAGALCRQETICMTDSQSHVQHGASPRAGSSAANGRPLPAATERLGLTSSRPADGPSSSSHLGASFFPTAAAAFIALMGSRRRDVADCASKHSDATGGDVPGCLLLAPSVDEPTREASPAPAASTTQQDKNRGDQILGLPLRVLRADTAAREMLALPAVGELSLCQLFPDMQDLGVIWSMFMKLQLSSIPQVRGDVALRPAGHTTRTLFHLSLAFPSDQTDAVAELKIRRKPQHSTLHGAMRSTGQSSGHRPALKRRRQKKRHSRSTKAG